MRSERDRRIAAAKRIREDVVIDGVRWRGKIDVEMDAFGTVRIENIDQRRVNPAGPRPHVDPLQAGRVDGDQRDRENGIASDQSGASVAQRALRPI